ncbi:MAG: HPr kinase/phosphorylase [Paracoccus sp. (in: a-proteobacteria)]
MSGDEILHASAVSVNGRGVLIVGPSGSGKSTLALQLLAFGGVLISDDRVILRRRDGALWGRAPAAIAGLVEARGVGLIRAAHAPAPLRLVVDLGQTETERLPPRREFLLAGQELPLVLGPFSAHLAFAIRQLVLEGCANPETDLLSTT